MACTNENKLSVHLINGVSYVWNADDANTLRETHRICGELVGCHPRFARQSVQLSLPLQLMNEEVALLLEKGLCQLLDGDVQPGKPSEAERQRFKNTRERLYQEQVAACKEKRKREIAQMMDKIKEGRKAKRQKLKELAKLKLAQKPEDADGEACTPRDTADAGGMEKAMSVDAESGSEDEEGEEEAVPIATLPRKHSMVQISLAPIFRNFEEKPATWHFPSTPLEQLRYKTFKKLWEQNYYVTAGKKFGGDFLVYPGDPAIYHAQYIAICLLPEEPITALEMSTLGRLSTKVKKTTLLCSLDEQEQVTFTSLQWAAIT